MAMYCHTAVGKGCGKIISEWLTAYKAVPPCDSCEWCKLQKVLCQTYLWLRWNRSRNLGMRTHLVDKTKPFRMLVRNRIALKANLAKGCTGHSVYFCWFAHGRYLHQFTLHADITFFMCILKFSKRYITTIATYSCIVDREAT